MRAADSQQDDPLAVEVLRFWFGDSPGARDRRWFEKNEPFDAEIRERFLPLFERAAADALDAWKESGRSCLALVLVLDQFPRNMFRGGARAYAGDRLALGAAKHALERGFHRAMRPVEQLFLYLPFEHSESLNDQLLACDLMEPLTAFPETADAHRFAVRHCDIIRRFGRFPHRNAVLGRENTAVEIEFLKERGSSF